MKHCSKSEELCRVMLGDICQNVNPFLHHCQAASRRRFTLLTTSCYTAHQEL